jgi:molybdopterin synthase catalytic subunit
MDIADAKVWQRRLPLQRILASYRRNEDASAGTVVVHAGRVKLPGKVVEKMTHVSLESLLENPADELRRIGEQAAARFAVNRIQIHHRIGRASPGDDLLVVLVSSNVRGPAFEACAWVVDKIKREKIIKLVERE